MLMGLYDPYWWHRPKVCTGFGIGANTVTETFPTVPVRQVCVTWASALRVAEKARPKAATKPKIYSYRHFRDHRAWVVEYHPMTFAWNG